MQANASEGFIAGCMSERYISVVTRATSLALYISWICWQRSRRPTRSYCGCLAQNSGRIRHSGWFLS